MDNPAEIPASWAPWLPIAGSLLRAILAAGGAAGITWAQAVTASQAEQILGALAIALSGLWSVMQKIQANRAIQEAAAQPPRMTPPALPV